MCWLPYGPKQGRPHPYTMPYPPDAPPAFGAPPEEVTGRITKLYPTHVMDYKGRVWDISVCPTWLFRRT